MERELICGSRWTVPPNSLSSASTGSMARIRRRAKSARGILNKLLHTDATMEVFSPSIMKCKICNTRKPRRYCPGVGGDICSICCGSEREVTVDCPLDCAYLVEARQHENPPVVSAGPLPNQDVRISEEFLRDHEPLLIFLGAKLLEASMATAGAVDSDVQEALETLIRTYRTLESGLYYETRPNNLLAAGIHQKIQ